MATLSQMGIPGSGGGILHPKQKLRWNVTFSNLGALVPGGSRDLTRQATKISRPSLSFDEVPIHRYNSTAYVAGKYTWDQMTLTIEDDIGGAATTAIQNQLQTQQRLIGSDLPSNWLNSAATGSDYKFGLIMSMLDGNEGVVEQWLLEGCWLMKCNWGDLDYSSSEAVNIDLTLRFDLATQSVTGQGYGTALGGALQ